MRRKQLHQVDHRIRRRRQRNHIHQQPLGDDIPGLETVLAEGNMRLYRIDASAWA